MTNRPNPFATAPQLIQPLVEFGTSLGEAGIEPALYELVKLRASQINGCAVCLDMHSKHAMAMGETAMRIIQLPGWRHSQLYNARERAALEWTEALTVLGHEAEREGAFPAVNAAFTPQEQVTLTLMITVINAFNRLLLGFAVTAPAAQDKAA